MAEKVAMPKAAKAMKRGKIVKWKAREGELIQKGQIILVVETEKVALECESPASGYLHIVGELEKIYAVGETIALIAATEAELKEIQASHPAPEAVQNPPAGAGGGRHQPQPANAPAPKGRVKTSPAAKKLDQSHGLDISKIAGTGPGGRIKNEDVIKYLQSGDASAPEAVPAGAPGDEPVDGKQVKAVIPESGMRKSIADHMMQSLTDSAQLSNMGEIDMTELVRLRKSFLAKEEEIGFRVCYTDMIVMLLSRAVQYVPIVNASIVDDEIRIWRDINVGVAVEKVVIAARRPNTAGLGLRQAGVRLNENGSIDVGATLQTSVAGIYAVGDCTGGWMNSHAASAMGVTAAENALGQPHGFPFELMTFRAQPVDRRLYGIQYFTP